MRAIVGALSVGFPEICALLSMQLGSRGLTRFSVKRRPGSQFVVDSAIRDVVVIGKVHVALFGAGAQLACGLRTLGGSVANHMRLLSRLLCNADLQHAED